MSRVNRLHRCLGDKYKLLDKDPSSPPPSLFFFPNLEIDFGPWNDRHSIISNCSFAGQVYRIHKFLTEAATMSVQSFSLSYTLHLFLARRPKLFTVISNGKLCTYYLMKVKYLYRVPRFFRRWVALFSRP